MLLCSPLRITVCRDLRLLLHTLILNGLPDSSVVASLPIPGRRCPETSVTVETMGSMLQ